MTSFTPPAYARGTAPSCSATCSAPYYDTATLDPAGDHRSADHAQHQQYADPPAPLQTGISTPVLFDISSLHAAGQNISDISTPVYFDAADQIDGDPHVDRRAGAIRRRGDCVYYVTIV